MANQNQPTDIVEKLPGNSPICQWHAARLRDLDVAYKGVSSELVPVVVRLEEKTEFLADRIQGFQDQLSKIQDLITKESAGNIGRDCAIKTVTDEMVTRIQHLNQLYWGFGKVILTIVATVVATALLIFFKLK